MNTISSWLKQTLLMAYDEDGKPTGVKVRQVRSLAALWALRAKAYMEDIMLACSWKGHNTFSQFYVKDLAVICDQICHLGPVVVALHIFYGSIPLRMAGHVGVDVWETCGTVDYLLLR